MPKLLIVDDERSIRSLVAKYAKFSDFETFEAENGLEAIEMCKKTQFDAVILDIMMPELDGFSTCREIRKFSQVPILLLSARGEEYDRINGFESGADDYIVKPFSTRELILRVNAVLRRVNTTVEPKSEPKKEEVDSYTFDNIVVNFSARKVIIDGVESSFSPKEYDLLFYLIRNKGIALSRQKIIEDIWGYEFFGDDRTLDTHIKLLRKKLGKYDYHIVTLRSMGYRFDE